MISRPFTEIPRIVVVNGDVCSGSSTIAREISTSLSYDYVDVGQLFRLELKRDPSLNLGRLSLQLNEKVRDRIATGSKCVIEGRLVGQQAQGFEDIGKVLCTAQESVILRRYMEREGIPYAELAMQSLTARYTHDDEILSKTWGITRADALNPGLYDVAIDTSHSSPAEIVRDLGFST